MVEHEKQTFINYPSICTKSTKPPIMCPHLLKYLSLAVIIGNLTLDKLARWLNIRTNVCHGHCPTPTDEISTESLPDAAARPRYYRHANFHCRVFSDDIAIFQWSTESRLSALATTVSAFNIGIVIDRLLRKDTAAARIAIPDGRIGHVDIGESDHSAGSCVAATRRAWKNRYRAVLQVKSLLIGPRKIGEHINSHRPFFSPF
jgi:hypothetical protein